MSTGDFASWFHQITGHAAPWDWQIGLAAAPCCRNRLARIGTGLGKTEGVLAAWLWHCLQRDDPMWPRRLVWCLPMRVLVEQTEHTARTLAAGLPPQTRPEVFVIMGGQDAGFCIRNGRRSSSAPKTCSCPARSTAATPARWPVEFAWLDQDAVWVIDEVQLMDIGVATSAQLQVFR